MIADIFITDGPGIANGVIVPAVAGRLTIDASGLDVLPGLIDVHGDAFERALQPRPGIFVPMDIALAELEAQLLAAGITTAFLAITLSWEAGLRSRGTYELLRDALLRRPPGRSPDLRLHVRFEAHNLDCLDLLGADIDAGHIGMVSFNDHTPSILRKLGDPAAAAKYLERAGQTLAQFSADAARAEAAPPAAVDSGRRRLAGAALRKNLPMASHDDPSVAGRAVFRALGVAISEFPTTQEVAHDAVAHGELTVMGAPNVVRGGSHIGWHGAETLVRQGLCSVLCSDYHYPSLLHAPYRLAHKGTADFLMAMALVSANAAALARLHDRGALDFGMRADIILVDPGLDRAAPRVVAVIAGGKLAYLAADAAARLSLTA